MSTTTLTPDQIKAMKSVFDQISESLTAIHTERTHIKDMLNAATDKFQLDKKTLKKAALLYHKQSVAQFEEETADIKSIYKQVAG